QPGEPAAVLRELRPDRLVGTARILAGDVHEVDERPAALGVGEELVAEPGAARRALDQARDVGEHELALVRLHRAQHGLDRGERVVGDLRSGPREAAEERRLARVRLADEAGVGEQLEPELDPARLALEPALGEARRLARGAGEALVAVTAQPTLRDHGALARLDEVVAAPAEALDLGARRHGHEPVLPARAVALLALPVGAAPGAYVRGPAQRLEVAPRGVADQDDVAAAPAVAAVAAAPALDVDPRSIAEHTATRAAAAPRSSRGAAISRSVGGDRDHAAPAATLELNHPRAGGEDRVVAPEAGALAGPEAGAALANDDLAAAHALACEDLDAEHLRVRVAAVPARSKPLLVRHYRSPSFLALRAAGFRAGAFFVAGFEPDDFAVAARVRAGFAAARPRFAAGSAGLRARSLTSVTSSFVSSERWPARRR